MGKIFVISDTHFCHQNIIKYCNRPFEDVNVMDETLIVNWNKVVSPDDVVIHLGDFALSGAENIKRIVARLNGNKILIMGNHDHLTKTAYKKAGFFTVVGEQMVIDFGDRTIVFSHHPKENPDYLNIHGHTHDNNLYAIDDGKHICVCVEAIDYTPIELNTLLEQYDAKMVSK